VGTDDQLRFAGPKRLEAPPSTWSATWPRRHPAVPDPIAGSHTPVCSFLGGRGEADPAHADDLSGGLTLGLLLDLVCDRERNLVLLDAGVENLVVEERGGLRFEEDAGSLLIDHLVILSG
jgi:hypothetical protein